MSKSSSKPVSQSVSLSGVGTSNFILTDPSAQPFLASVAVYLSDGADLTFTVEHTLYPLSNPSEANVPVVPTRNMISKTANCDQNYFVPISGVRLKITNHTTGTATMYVLQSGGRN